LRDEYRCQYCGVTVTDLTATLDHVHPVSLGGKTTWENSTTACKPCNYRKANHIGKMKPMRLPYKPNFWDLVAKRKAKGYNMAHASWAYYLA
jgi:5-methylcytosine-specific restriction endonuclease McrA